MDVKVPSLAESVTEADIGRWIRKDGDTVRKGEAILELQTDKASLEISADASGTLRTLEEEGATVTVGQVVARIEEGAAGGGAASKASGAERESAGSGGAAKPGAEPEREPASPAGSAERDGKKGEAKPAPKAKAPPAEPPPEIGPAVKAHREPVAAPPDRPRVVHERVDQGGEEAETRPPPADGDRPSRPARADEPGTRRERMTRLRRRIAERLVEAQRTAAILTTFNQVDMTAILELRKQNQEWFQARHGVKLGFVSLFGRACIATLAEIPKLNAFIEGDEIVYHDRVHLGIAVGTERGLVVPVVREADRMSLGELETEIQRLAGLARDGKLAVEDLEGGTFTISNGGVYGSLLSTPILNPPQSGILGMHAIEKRPVADAQDRVVVRPMMYVALSYDHRIIDGAEAVTFLVKVKQRLEDPERMLLET